MWQTVASAAACGAALALRAGGAGSDGADDVAARLAALAQFPSGDNGSPTAVSDADDGLPGSAEVPAPRSHRSGGWPAAASGAHAAVDQAEEDQAEGDRAEGDPVDGSGAHRAGGSTTTDEPEDALLAALGGFTGTLGATNTAGLLSGYTPPSGLATTGQATALVTEAGELAGAADAAQWERPVGRRPGRRRGRRARAGSGAHAGPPARAQPDGAGDHRRCGGGGGRDRDAVPLAGAADDEQRDQPARAAGPRAHEPRGTDLGPDPHADGDAHTDAPPAPTCPDPTGGRAPGRRDDAGPERDHRADRADGDDLGAPAVGVDRPADDDGEARRRLTPTGGVAS